MPQRGWCSLSPVAASDPWCEVRGSQGRQEQCPVPHLPLPRPALRAWVPQTGCCLPALGTRGTLPVPATPTGLPLPRSARAARTEQRRAGALDRASSPKASSPAGRDSVSRAEPSRARLRSRRSAAPLPRDHSTRIGLLICCGGWKGWQRDRWQEPAAPPWARRSPALSRASTNLSAQGNPEQTQQRQRTVTAPPEPPKAGLRQQHQPQFDLLMAFYLALNWVGKRHVPYPKSSLIALHGAGH